MAIFRLVYSDKYEKGEEKKMHAEWRKKRLHQFISPFKKNREEADRRFLWTEIQNIFYPSSRDLSESHLEVK